MVQLAFPSPYAHRRFLSHMLHERNAFGLVPQVGLDDDKLGMAVMNHTSGSWSPGSWPLNGGVLDNYITRYLAGHSSLGRPFKAGVHNVTNIVPVNRAMYDRAAHNLLNMDAVMVLEEASSPASGELLMALGLEPFAQSTREGTSFSLQSDYSRLDSAVQGRLQELHLWDHLLFGLARERHRQFLEAWVAMEA